jgi:hypothetical protein
MSDLLIQNVPQTKPEDFTPVQAEVCSDKPETLSSTDRSLLELYYLTLAVEILAGSLTDKVLDGATANVPNTTRIRSDWTGDKKTDGGEAFLTKFKYGPFYSGLIKRFSSGFNTTFTQQVLSLKIKSGKDVNKPDKIGQLQSINKLLKGNLSANDRKLLSLYNETLAVEVLAGVLTDKVLDGVTQNIPNTTRIRSDWTGDKKTDGGEAFLTKFKYGPFYTGMLGRFNTKFKNYFNAKVLSLKIKGGKDVGKPDKLSQLLTIRAILLAQKGKLCPVIKKFTPKEGAQGSTIKEFVIEAKAGIFPHDAEVELLLGKANDGNIVVGKITPSKDGTKLTFKVEIKNAALAVDDPKTKDVKENMRFVQVVSKSFPKKLKATAQTLFTVTSGGTKRSVKINPPTIYRNKKQKVTQEIKITFKNYPKLPDKPEVEVQLGNSAGAKVKAVAGSVVRVSDNTLKVKISVEKDAKLAKRTLVIKGFATLSDALAIAEKSRVRGDVGKAADLLNMRWGPDRDGQERVRATASGAIQSHPLSKVPGDADPMVANRLPHAQVSIALGGPLYPVPFWGPSGTLFNRPYLWSKKHGVGFELAGYFRGDLLVLGGSQKKNADILGMLAFGIYPRFLFNISEKLKLRGYIGGYAGLKYQDSHYPASETRGFPGTKTIGLDRVGGELGLRTPNLDISIFGEYQYLDHSYTDPTFGIPFDGFSQRARVGTRINVWASRFTAGAPDVSATFAIDPTGEIETPLDAEGGILPRNTAGSYELNLNFAWNKAKTKPYARLSLTHDFLETHPDSLEGAAGLGLRDTPLGSLDLSYQFGRNVTQYDGGDLDAARLNWRGPGRADILTLYAEGGQISILENLQRVTKGYGGFGFSIDFWKLIFPPPRPKKGEAVSAKRAKARKTTKKEIKFKNPEQYLKDKCMEVAGGDAERCRNNGLDKNRKSKYKTKKAIDKYVYGNYQI